MRPSIIAALLAASSLSGCAATPSSAGEASASVEGRATFYEKLLMPAESVLRVELVDMSRDNDVLVREEFRSLPGPPYAFTLRYAPASVPDGARLGLHAALFTPRGERMFVTAEAVPVVDGSTQPAEFRMLRSP
ncbi:hypothetical protein E4582_02550 [Luteimonas yindakuii]|uniref:Lipoprotein n=1 Tax=Luteimonas yindakuii TaxID=2565782 RepID=A0A4Z1R2N1_9GAMM|nr:YbaY family lipoprotein [Luteimonas yindakuii]TKS53760.1 hypothetical protein E4582_02550 [Luteimonas yindakuii]